ncbi:unnamed protein product [Parnassius apollo]|uniref:(apollo) hypothetical protein n=1 Tax=Parnassius apollo TaxID=110799 RepID=A0A8S3XDJ1_PARAO|nr:unnamed protein product [Parnassius apollo]
MESDSALQGDLPDGAEMSPLAENPPENAETSESNLPVHDSQENPTEETGQILLHLATNGAPTSSSDVMDENSEIQTADSEEHPPHVQGNAEAEDEMDIDDSTPGNIADESTYIGDNCLSTPAVTEDNSPQEDSQSDPMLKEPVLDENEGADAAQEESPDQSISSAMPIEGDGAPIIQDEHSFAGLTNALLFQKEELQRALQAIVDFASDSQQTDSKYII